MTRFLYSLIQLFMGKTEFDSLEVGQEQELTNPARFDKGTRKYRVRFIVYRER